MGNETGTQGQQNAEGQQNNANQQNTAGQQKTFTQEELDAIIAERLGRERQKYADYDSLIRCAIFGVSFNSTRSVAVANGNCAYFF